MNFCVQKRDSGPQLCRKLRGNLKRITIAGGETPPGVREGLFGRLPFTPNAALPPGEAVLLFILCGLGGMTTSVEERVLELDGPSGPSGVALDPDGKFPLVPVL